MIEKEAKANGGSISFQKLGYSNQPNKIRALQEAVNEGEKSGYWDAQTIASLENGLNVTGGKQTKDYTVDEKDLRKLKARYDSNPYKNFNHRMENGGTEIVLGVMLIGTGIGLKVYDYQTSKNASNETAEPSAGAEKGNAAESGEGGSNTTRVGRWMSQEEYDKMISSGKVQMSGDNKVHVANPADIDAFGKKAPKGSLYVEFDVPSNTISQGGTDGWGIINGPGSLMDRLNAKKGLPRITEMPNATNITIEGSK